MTTVSIDGVAVRGTLTMEQDWIDVSVMTETRPDPSWEFADAVGHFHAWAEDKTLPTLKSITVHVPCGGGCCEDDCEGYYRDEYRCLICDEQVDPALIVNTNPPRRQIRGLQSWVAEVACYVERGKKVSVVAGEYFGIGTAFSNSGTPDGSVSELQCGPMAKRLRDNQRGAAA